MTTAMAINLVTIILCLAVLVQSLRLMRALRAVRSPDFGAIIQRLDQATGNATMVFNGLHAILAGDVTRATTKLQTAAAIRDELALLIDLAESRAERLVAAAAAPPPPAASSAASSTAAPAASYMAPMPARPRAN